MMARPGIHRTANLRYAADASSALRKLLAQIIDEVLCSCLGSNLPICPAHLPSGKVP